MSERLTSFQLRNVPLLSRVGADRADTLRTDIDAAVAGWADAVQAARDVLAASGVPASAVSVTAAQQRPWHPGRCAAIEVNGVQTNFNRRAFLWGRRAAHDLAAVEAVISTAPKPAAARTLDDIVAHRSEFLTAYQDAAYARRYRERVQRVRDAEAAGRRQEEPGRERGGERGGEEARAPVDKAAGHEHGEQERQERVAGRQDGRERQGRRHHGRHDAARGEVLGPNGQGARAGDRRPDDPGECHDHRERPGAAKSPPT